MDTAMVNVTKVIEVGLKIKEAVDTVHQNKQDCAMIGNRVSSLNLLLSWLLKQKIQLNPELSTALEDLEKTLGEAYDLIKACQKKHIISHLFSSSSLAEQLIEVNQKILDQMEIARVGLGSENDGLLAQYEAGLQQDVEKANSSSQSRSSTGGPRSEVNVDTKSGTAATVDALKRFSFSELEVATNDFSKQNFIEKRDYFTAYKGILADGVQVSIKKHYYQEKSLPVQVSVFLRVGHHENLVEFLGYCHEKLKEDSMSVHGSRVSCGDYVFMVVEEYMWDRCLLDGISWPLSKQPDWFSTSPIIQGVAQGLSHLHSKRIVHADLNPGNILFDNAMNPKICNYEYLRLAARTHTETVLTAATSSFLSPESLEQGLISFQSDVYSFGCIVLYIIGALSGYGLRSGYDLIDWAKEVWGDQAMHMLFDPSICDESQLKEIERCMEIGLVCTQEIRRDRPTMSDVMDMLSGKKEIPSRKA